MAADDARRVLLELLEQWVGSERARELMAYIPPYRWEDLATKQDLYAVRNELVARFDGRFDAMDGRFDAVDGRFDAVDGRFDAVNERFAGVNGRLDGVNARLDGLVERFDVMQALTSQTRTLMLALVVAVAAIGSLALSLAQFS